MVGETNSVVGHHLLADGHLIQLEGGRGAVALLPPSPHQIQGSVLIITIILILIIIFSEFPIKSQSVSVSSSLESGSLIKNYVYIKLTI